LEELGFYTDVNQRLMGLEKASLAKFVPRASSSYEPPPTIFRSLAATVTFMIGEEDFGLHRARGSLALSAYDGGGNYFPALPDELTFRSLISRYDTATAITIDLMRGSDAPAFQRAVNQTAAFDRVRATRATLLAADNAAPNAAPTAPVWWDDTTTCLTEHNKFEINALRPVSRKHFERVESAHTSFLVSFSVLLGFASLSTLVAFGSGVAVFARVSKDAAVSALEAKHATAVHVATKTGYRKGHAAAMASKARIISNIGSRPASTATMTSVAITVRSAGPVAGRVLSAPPAPFESKPPDPPSVEAPLLPHSLPLEQDQDQN
jgi:hypothetical protein